MTVKNSLTIYFVPKSLIKSPVIITSFAVSRRNGVKVGPTSLHYLNSFFVYL